MQPGCVVETKSGAMASPGEGRKSPEHLVPQDRISGLSCSEVFPETLQGAGWTTENLNFLGGLPSFVQHIHIEGL